MKVEDIVEFEKQTMTDKKFDKLMVEFLLDEPFFASIVMNLKKIKTKSIPTAGVTVRDNSLILYWNPEFVSKLSKKHFFGLMKHECYHLIYQHVLSRKQDPHTLWNIATDLAINSLIDESYLPEGGLIPGKAFKNNSESKVSKEVEERYKNMSNFIENLPRCKASEWYMEKLKSNKEIAEDFEKSFGSGESAGFDVHIDGDGEMSDSDKEIIKGKIKEIVKKAANKANSRSSGWGSVSGKTRQEIMNAISDKIDWKKTLQYFCGTKQKSKKSRTYRRINRKYPYIHPGTKTRRTSSLAIYIDQSGSVGNDGLSMFFSVLEGLAKDVSFKVFHFDTEVDLKSEYNWRRGQKYRDPMRTLSGGTCFDAVENHYRTRSAEFDGYIIMTDGMAPKPKSCISKRCWVILPGYEMYFKKDKRDAIVQMEA
tara:strand:+ start:118 stop:1389 length:1272 start_codon:yes stop_codon:yes gene_type:complete